MGEFVPTLSWEYALLLVLLLASRGLDMLSTWVATPNLVLEANPLARLLGWTGSIIVQTIFCIGMAKWPLPAIAISTDHVAMNTRAEPSDSPNRRKHHPIPSICTGPCRIA